MGEIITAGTGETHGYLYMVCNRKLLSLYYNFENTSFLILF